MYLSAEAGDGEVRAGLEREGEGEMVRVEAGGNHSGEEAEGFEGEAAALGVATDECVPKVEIRVGYPVEQVAGGREAARE